MVRQPPPENKIKTFGYIPEGRNSRLGMTADFKLGLRFTPYKHLTSHCSSDPVAGCYTAWYWIMIHAKYYKAPESVPKVSNTWRTTALTVTRSRAKRLERHFHSNGETLPIKSVTLSVTALEARMNALSLSSYFIFISKNPERRGDMSSSVLPLHSWIRKQRAMGCRSNLLVLF